MAADHCRQSGNRRHLGDRAWTNRPVRQPEML